MVRVWVSGVSLLKKKPDASDVGEEKEDVKVRRDLGGETLRTNKPSHPKILEFLPWGGRSRRIGFCTSFHSFQDRQLYRDSLRFQKSLLLSITYHRPMGDRPKQIVASWRCRDFQPRRVSSRTEDNSRQKGPDGWILRTYVKSCCY
jgi:hypothetical protein